MNGFVCENLFPNTGMSITNIFCQATEKNKTKQSKTKRFLVCQPDDNNLAIKGQLNVLVFQFIVTPRVVVKDDRF